MSGSFGNQGAAQAQNLRDSGIPNNKIIVANRPDSYAEDAKAKGFNVEHNFANAAKDADGRSLGSAPFQVLIVVVDSTQ